MKPDMKPGRQHAEMKSSTGKRGYGRGEYILWPLIAKVAPAGQGLGE